MVAHRLITVLLLKTYQILENLQNSDFITTIKYAYHIKFQTYLKTNKHGAV
jgi:hypothetical protein